MAFSDRVFQRESLQSGTFLCADPLSAFTNRDCWDKYVWKQLIAAPLWAVNNCRSNAIVRFLINPVLRWLDANRAKVTCQNNSELAPRWNGHDKVAFFFQTTWLQMQLWCSNQKRHHTTHESFTLNSSILSPSPVRPSIAPNSPCRLGLCLIDRQRLKFKIYIWYIVSGGFLSSGETRESVSSAQARRWEGSGRVCGPDC